jgi:hypothetical protein
MKTKEYWENKYCDIIQESHKYNSPGYTLSEFLKFSNKTKLKILRYYEKQSLLKYIEDDDFFKVDKDIIECPSEELCNFLHN